MAVALLLPNLLSLIPRSDWQSAGRKERRKSKIFPFVSDKEEEPQPIQLSNRSRHHTDVGTVLLSISFVLYREAIKIVSTLAIDCISRWFQLSISPSLRWKLSLCFLIRDGIYTHSGKHIAPHHTEFPSTGCRVLYKVHIKRTI